MYTTRTVPAPYQYLALRLGRPHPLTWPNGLRPYRFVCHDHGKGGLTVAPYGGIRTNVVSHPRDLGSPPGSTPTLPSPERVDLFKSENCSFPIYIALLPAISRHRAFLRKDVTSGPKLPRER
ncbi:hypothetical protein R1flu_027801 [Riccia fluitans]|uniref:Uncharacterized protein n=1 Tax=Riccia fluitans TaxID=41844 RepID=A0ABD1XKJ5_9MARC